jgi:hypothetical protein
MFIFSELEIPFKMHLLQKLVTLCHFATLLSINFFDETVPTVNIIYFPLRKGTAIINFMLRRFVKLDIIVKFLKYFS